MTHEFYQAYKPKERALETLNQITSIVKDYQAQGLTLTLRQLYYQLVSQDLIANKESEYKRVGEVVSRARRGGLLDWEALEDRVRQPVMPPEYDGLDDLMEAALHTYRLPRLKGQESYVELWVEKDALAGVIAPIARQWHVALMVNRGYSSTSAMKASGERLRRKCVEIGAENVHVLYLGDLDPSGEDMVRDISERLEEYINQGVLVFREGSTVTVEEEEDRRDRLYPHIDLAVTKLALTMDQVRTYSPPPNPAKRTDSRFAKFSEEHGNESWEVDALPPRILRDLIVIELERLIDSELVETIKQEEVADKALLRTAVKGLQKK